MLIYNWKAKFAKAITLIIYLPIKAEYLLPG